MFFASPKQAQTQQPPLVSETGPEYGIQSTSPENTKSQGSLCASSMSSSHAPGSQGRVALRRKRFGSLRGVLCLPTRAHPGLGYCPYKTAQGGCEPSVLNVPGRKMLAMNPCGRTVQYNCNSTQPRSPGRPGGKRSCAQAPGGLPAPPAAAPRAGLPSPPAAQGPRSGAPGAVIRGALHFRISPTGEVCT